MENKLNKFNNFLRSTTRSFSSQQSSTRLTGSFFVPRIGNIKIVANYRFNISLFDAFTRALNTLGHLDLRASYKVNNFINSLILFTLLFYSLDSDYIKYLTESQRTVLFPRFIVNVQNLIAKCVRNTSRLNSIIECVSNVDSHVKFRETLIRWINPDLPDLEDFLKDTVFSTIIKSATDIALVRSSLESKVLPLFLSETREEFFSVLTDLISFSVAELSSGTRSIPSIQVKHSEFVTTHLGIFRFRSTPDVNIYFVNFLEITAVPSHLREFFSMILILFKPGFYQVSNYFDQVAGHLGITSGDIPLDFNNFDFINVFKELIDYSKPSRPPVTPRVRPDTPPAVPPTTTQDVQTPAAHVLIEQLMSITHSLSDYDIHDLPRSSEIINSMVQAYGKNNTSGTVGSSDSVGNLFNLAIIIGLLNLVKLGVNLRGLNLGIEKQKLSRS